MKDIILPSETSDAIDLDNYNPDKLSSDNKKLMNKKNVWSL